MKRIAWIGLLLLAVTVQSAQARERGREVTAQIDADGVQRVAIVGGSYYFDPERVVVKVNVPVELTLKKEAGGLTPHSFLLQAPEAGIDVKIGLSSAPKTVTFTPKKTGRYPYYCDKKLLFAESHRQKGMAGVLEVVP